MKIAYDARLSLGQYRGMGRFLRFLIQGRECEFLGFCATGEGDASLKLVAAGFSFYPLWEQVSLPHLISIRNINTFLAPYNTAPLRLPRRVKLVLVVHDLIFMEPLPPSKSMYQNIGRLYRRLVVPRAIRRADVVVTVSHYTAELLVSRFALDSRKVRVIPNSIGEEWFGDDIERAIQPRYVLVVAGEAPSKNLSRAIAAFAQCRNLGDDLRLRLKVAGVKERFHAVYREQAHALGVEDFVDFLTYVPDAEIRGLYQQAELFVMPSLSEGFGIPVLEAMASGVPVAASSATCLPEIGGDAARYFDPYSVEDMSTTMHEILNDEGLRMEMSELGKVQARRFHPELVRKQIQSLWAEIKGTAEGALAKELAL